MKKQSTITETLSRLEPLLGLTLGLRLSAIEDRKLVARADINIDEKKDLVASV